MINRGPISALGSAGGFVPGPGVTPLLAAFLLAAPGLLSGPEPSAGFSFEPATGLLSSFASSVDFFAAPVVDGDRLPVLGLAGTRARAFLFAVAFGAAAGFSVAPAFAAVAVIVAVADSAGVGSGVGAAATSAWGGAGSAIRAPTDETRLPCRPPGLLLEAAR